MPNAFFCMIAKQISLQSFLTDLFDLNTRLENSKFCWIHGLTQEQLYPGFYEKMYISDSGISCLKTPSEKRNNLGQNPKVAVITLLSCLFFYEDWKKDVKAIFNIKTIYLYIIIRFESTKFSHLLYLSCFITKYIFLFLLLLLLGFT